MSIFKQVQVVFFGLILIALPTSLASPWLSLFSVNWFPSPERYSMHFFTVHASKHEYIAMASFQTTASIGKTWDKYCLLSFMDRNKIGLLTPFAKINKRGGLNELRLGGKKI